MPKTITPTPRTKVKRAPNRAEYDLDTIYAILDAGLLCHVGYVIDGQPFVTPTCYWREGNRVYWRGSAASRMIRAQETGIPVCFTVSHLDGLVLARSGFHHSVNYRSVMLLGEAHAIDDDQEMMRALEVFMERLTPGRWPELRPANKQEIKGATALWMEINEVSAKVRADGAIDDEEDYDWDVWAGVVPITTTIGEPEDDARLKPGIVRPDYLSKFQVG